MRRFYKKNNRLYGMTKWDDRIFNKLDKMDSKIGKMVMKIREVKSDYLTTLSDRIR